MTIAIRTGTVGLAPSAASTSSSRSRATYGNRNACRIVATTPTSPESDPSPPGGLAS